MMAAQKCKKKVGRIFFAFLNVMLMSMMMVMMMMMMNSFCGMVDQREVFSLISSRDHCQRSSPSRISDMPWAGFEPVENLISGLVKWSCAVVITTTPQHHRKPKVQLTKIHNSLDSSRPHRRLVENQKRGSSRELFLPENDFQTSSTINFPKNIQILEAWKPTKDIKFRLEFFCTCPSKYELNIIGNLFWALNTDVFKVP